jgi:hypothetical protein
VEGVPHTISALLDVSKLNEEGPDSWDLSINCYSRPPVASERVSKRLNFFSFMRKLEKSSLATSARVSGLFTKRGGTPLTPRLPASGKWLGGVFTHVLGYTLARMSDVGDLLYEVTVRSTTPGVMDLDVGFVYNSVLSEDLITDVLERATKLAVLLVVADSGDDIPSEEQEPQASPTLEHGNIHGAQDY